MLALIAEKNSERLSELWPGASAAFGSALGSADQNAEIPPAAQALTPLAETACLALLHLARTLSRRPGVADLALGALGPALGSLSALGASLPMADKIADALTSLMHERITDAISEPASWRAMLVLAGVTAAGSPAAAAAGLETLRTLRAEINAEITRGGAGGRVGEYLGPAATGAELAAALAHARVAPTSSACEGAIELVRATCRLHEPPRIPRIAHAWPFTSAGLREPRSTRHPRRLGARRI